jgi:hypothetical protein
MQRYERIREVRTENRTVKMVPEINWKSQKQKLSKI